jgi:putative ABC transport system permease protein
MLSDFRLAWRTLARRPWFTCVVVITVAIGIGASTAIFSVVNAVLIRDLPYADAERIYVMRAIGPDGLPGNVSRREFAPIYEREDHPTVEAAAIVWSQETQIAGADQIPHPTVRYGVTDQFFDVFGTRMALGRGFEPEDRPGRIVISYPIWRDVFGADPNIIGKPVSAEGMALEVVGVTPADFEFPQNPGFWYLMRIDESRDNVRVYRGFMRLRPNRSEEQIRTDVARLARELGPDPVTGRQPVLVADSFLEYVVGNLKGTVLILFGATAVLLLVACINIAHLLLSRAAVRAREVALREAIGANRYRIVRQLLAETLVLVGIGATLGLGLAALSVGTLRSILPAGQPRLEAMPIDGTVLLFAGAAALVTTVLSGFAPAWRLARNDLRSLVNESGRGAPGRQRTFGALVATEVALAVVLVIAAGLLVRSYVNLTMTDPGFNPERALTVTMNVRPRMEFSGMRPGADGRPSFTSSPYTPLAVFLRELEERIARINGVESVALMTSLPLARNPFATIMTFAVTGEPGSEREDALATAPVRSVSAGYFSTMQMRVLSGRGLERSDREGTPGVTVVNESFARRYLSSSNPVGHRISIRDNRYVPTDSGFQFGHFLVDELEVVGVVSDAKYASLALPAEPAMYVSSDQFIDRRRALVVRTSLDRPESLIATVRAELTALDPQLAAQFAVYTSLVEESVARERMAMTLLSIFAGITLLLASVGVYGLMLYSVEQRTGEMALRSALGASARQVINLVMKRGMLLALAGAVIGVAGAIALRNVLAGQLFGVSPLDVPMLLLAPLAVLVVAAVACFVPARRAMRVDPANLLRVE